MNKMKNVHFLDRRKGERCLILQNLRQATIHNFSFTAHMKIS